jgi:Tol biopolymer transport system component
MNLRRTTNRASSGFGAGLVAPGLSVIGLVIVGALSLGLLTGNLPSLPGSDGGPGSSDGGGPVRTATPSNIVIVDPRTDVPGTLTYAKAGNIWLQRGAEAYQLTDGGHDGMPAFSPDGSWIYFIRTTAETGHWRVNGQTRRFRLAIPALMRVRPDGEGEPETLLTGRVTSGSLVWSTFMRQPTISPDGTKAAIITDGPDPTKKDVVLQILDLETLKLTDLGVPESAPLGHQDPTWSPDGRYLAYVQNGRDGSRGAPVIMRYDTTTGKATALTGPGYTTPVWSHDGRYMAATRTTAFGTDVVILDGRGAELLRVTNNGRSFSPVWSPVGDSLAYLEIDHGVTDLWLAPIDVTGSTIAAGEPLQLTIAAGLNAGSRPGWWVPPELIPTPPPTATPVPTVPSPSLAPGAVTP